MNTKSVKKTPVKKPAARKSVVKEPAAKKVVKVAAKKPVAKTVTFTLHADKGKSVYLAGEFNEWNPVAKKMTYKASSGYYAVSLKLTPGTYQYKFVLDGTWCADPLNANAVPNDHGTFNSVITVK